MFASFKKVLDKNNDILIPPAAPSAAYKIGEKNSDPLAMYAGDVMTFCHVDLLNGGRSAGLSVGFQMIGTAFDEERLLKVGYIFEQTLRGCSFIPLLVAEDLA